MRRYVLMMAVVIAVIVTACGGSDSSDSADPAPQENGDSVAVDEPAPDAGSGSGDDLADAQADALVTDGGMSPEDAAFVAQYPIPTLAGGDVLVTFEDGTVSQLNLAYPLWKKESILLHYDIWAQNTIVQSHLDDSKDNEGVWQGLNADGVLIRIGVFEPADMEDTVFVNLVWQP